MKKLFYTLLVVFTCFIGLNKVSALTLDLRPDNMFSCNADNSVCGTNQGSSLYNYTTSMPNTNFYGWPFSSRYSILRFTYTNLNIDTSTSKNFDITFKFFDNQYNNISQDALINYKPAVNINGKVCDTAFSSGIHFNEQAQNGNLIGQYSNFLSVSCDNVNLEGKFIVVEFYKVGVLSYGGGEVGIANIFSIYPTTDFGSAQKETNQKLDESINEQKEMNKKLDETNDTLKDDDTSESTSEATEFFEGFDTDTHGLTSIITAPLELIGNIAGSTCSPLPLQVPFVNKTMSLPCMSTIYKKHFGSFLTVYQTITFGIVAYWVCVRIFALVKDFKNPEHDEIEVMDL